MRLHLLSVTLSLSVLALLSALLMVDAKANDDLAVVSHHEDRN